MSSVPSICLSFVMCCVAHGLSKWVIFNLFVTLFHNQCVCQAKLCEDILLLNLYVILHMQNYPYKNAAYVLRILLGIFCTQFARMQLII